MDSSQVVYLHVLCCLLNGGAVRVAGWASQDEHVQVVHPKALQRHLTLLPACSPLTELSFLLGCCISSCTS